MRDVHDTGAMASPQKSGSISQKGEGCKRMKRVEYAKPPPVEEEEDDIDGLKCAICFDFCVRPVTVRWWWFGYVHINNVCVYMFICVCAVVCVRVHAHLILI